MNYSEYRLFEAMLPDRYIPLLRRLESSFGTPRLKVAWDGTYTIVHLKFDNYVFTETGVAKRNPLDPPRQYVGNSIAVCRVLRQMADRLGWRWNDTDHGWEKSLLETESSESIDVSELVPGEFYSEPRVNYNLDLPFDPIG